MASPAEAAGEWAAEAAAPSSQAAPSSRLQACPKVCARRLDGSKVLARQHLRARPRACVRRSRPMRWAAACHLQAPQRLVRAGTLRLCAYSNLGCLTAWMLPQRRISGFNCWAPHAGGCVPVGCLHRGCATWEAGPARAVRTRPIIVLDEGGQGGHPARLAAPRPGVLPFLGLRAPIHSVLGEIRVRVSQMRRLCNEKRACPSRDGFRLNATCGNDATIGALLHPSGFSLHNRRFSGKPDAFRRKMQPRSGPSRATRSDPARRRTAREGAGGAPRACCGTCWLA